MNIYNKVLIELNKQCSFKSQYNNLVKLQYSSEDRQLRNLISVWLNVLDSAESYRVRRLALKCQETLNINAYIKQNLVDYCNECIMSKKPEWQILAERYGWKPPM